VLDFTSKTDEELREELEKSSGRVCGLFKKSQLSSQFLKYVAATFIATSITAPALGQKVLEWDSLRNEREKFEGEKDEEIFLGIIVETHAAPIGGYNRFYAAVAKTMKYPEGLSEKGKVFVEFIIDTAGRMTDVKVIKGLNELAEKEAIRVFSVLNYPFEPGRQRGKAVRTRMVMPILFDPKGNVKK
jgi:protein TonB